MTNIEHIKLTIAAATRDAEDVVNGVRGLYDRLDETVIRLKAAATGSSHPKIDEAIRYLLQARDRLDEVSTLTSGAIDAAGMYRALI
jgi:hypothetical protein